MYVRISSRTMYKRLRSFGHWRKTRNNLLCSMLPVFGKYLQRLNATSSGAMVLGAERYVHTISRNRIAVVGRWIATPMVTGAKCAQNAPYLAYMAWRCCICWHKLAFVGRSSHWRILTGRYFQWRPFQSARAFALKCLWSYSVDAAIYLFGPSLHLRRRPLCRQSSPRIPCF